MQRDWGFGPCSYVWPARPCWRLWLQLGMPGERELAGPRVVLLPSMLPASVHNSCGLCVWDGCRRAGSGGKLAGWYQA